MIDWWRICNSEQTDLRLWEDDDCELTASSPPYFCGSPPTRVDNPLIHDPRFLQQNSYDIPTTTPAFFPATSLKTSVKDRRRGLFRSKKSSDSLGMIPAAVRIEGFDYLDHSSNNRGCRISGFAWLRRTAVWFL